VIFYGFYKLQLKHIKGVRFISRTDPWKELEVHRYTPALHKQPWKELQPCNVVLGPRGRRGRPDSGDLASGLGRGSCWGGSRVHGSLICGGEKTSGRAQRKPAAAAAGMFTPASLRSSLSNKRVCKLQRVLGEVVAALVGNGKDRKMELAVRVSHGAAAARLVACARDMEERALNRCGASCKGGNAVVQSSTGPRHGKYGKVGAATCGGAVTNGEWRCSRPTVGSGMRGTGLGLARITPALPLYWRRAPHTGGPSRASACARRRTCGAAWPVATQLSLFDCE
jgi:hypothetical protein